MATVTFNLSDLDIQIPQMSVQQCWDLIAFFNSILQASPPKPANTYEWRPYLGIVGDITFTSGEVTAIQNRISQAKTQAQSLITNQ